MQLESSVRHNTLFASKDNGFGGTDARLAFNSPLQVKHIDNLQKLAQGGMFSYGGRKSESQAKFYSGECAMFMGSSASLASIRKNAQFGFGVATPSLLSGCEGRTAEHHHRRGFAVGHEWSPGC